MLSAEKGNAQRLGCLKIWPAPGSGSYSASDPCSYASSDSESGCCCGLASHSSDSNPGHTSISSFILKQIRNYLKLKLIQIEYRCVFELILGGHIKYLPSSLKMCYTVDMFKIGLKTYLFNLSQYDLEKLFS